MFAGGDSWADGLDVSADVFMAIFTVSFVMVVCWVMLQITIVVLLDRCTCASVSTHACKYK